MADGGMSLKGLRAKLVAAAQAQADERRSQSVTSPVSSDSTPILAKAPTKPVIDGSILKTVERQRLAKERREERDKEVAAREFQLLEKEKKARLQYEKQVEERQKKLDEQKQKEQQKRVAVEEKRKQKQEEEKVHYEAVMRRTLERSQRLEQRQKRWSWGGALATEKENSDGVPEHSLTPSLNLSDCPPPSSDSQASTEDGSAIDKRSPSTANVMKQVQPGMSKRLSSSSTALLNSPDKSTVDKKRSSSLNRLAGNPRPSQSDKKEEVQARRSQNSPLESNIISRLLTPTQSSLARSKSAATLSEAGQSSAASARPINPPVNPPNKPLRSRSTDRQTPTPEAKDTTIEAIQKQIKEKRPSSPASTSRRRSPSPNLSKKLSWPASTPKSSSPAAGAKRPPSPPSTGAKRSTSPSTVKSSPKNRAASPSSFRQHPPSPPSVQKPLPIHRVPAASTAAKKKTEKEGKPKAKAEGAGSEHSIGHVSEKEPSAPSNKTKDPEQKPGTTSAEEAAKILAVNRRLAREQKEREEQERLQLEEAKRYREEQLKREAAEMSARSREEVCMQEEERKLADEENEKKAEEERIYREQEERERFADLQLQREEAETKASEETERQKVERDRITQQLQQERLARRKRIAEIMTRTRTPDQGESKKTDSGTAEESSEDERRNDDADDVDSTDEIDELQDNVQDCAEWSDEAAVGEETELNGVDKTNDTRGCLNKEQTVDVSPMPKEGDVSKRLHVNEVGEGVGHPNGKASTWILQDYIDLDVCSKVTKLAVTPCNADDCNQNLIDTTGIPDSHIIALEENGGVTSFTKPIEETSGL
ncbi:uncharacterized protein map7d3 isoform X3 [Scyliorhinus torazame]|uniref:uncharacterized protein map7d3 isoform X3 n=1 Tax=Scyliorhinus torazame TaxID=75743 RepID=UPI003B5CDC98